MGENHSHCCSHVQLFLWSYTCFLMMMTSNQIYHLSAGLGYLSFECQRCLCLESHLLIWVVTSLSHYLDGGILDAALWTEIKWYG